MAFRIMKPTSFWSNVSLWSASPIFFYTGAQEEQADGLVLTNRRADCSELSPYASHNSMLNVYSFHRFLLITPIFMACKSQYWSSKDEQMTKTIRMQLEEKTAGLHCLLSCSSQTQCTTSLNAYFLLSSLFHRTWRSSNEIQASVATKWASLEKQSYDSQSRETWGQ